MKLLFVCIRAFAMDVGLPEREPLGGSESAAAYLARQLAKNGHNVTFATRLPQGTPERVSGVRHVDLNALNEEFHSRENFDAIIALNAPAAAEVLRRQAPKALQVSWLQLLPRDAAMAPLAAMTPHIDYVVFVSHTQRAVFSYAGKTAVIGNGIAPAFENMFASKEDLRAAKQNRAAYTSMPYRGLHLLLEVIRGMRGETDFDIYSAMQTYRKPDTEFTGLYGQLKNAPRTRYHGSLAQPVLAQALRPAAFLSYPCAFIETYCIAALEAIAAGLKVVSLDLGALSETTLGFADLLPVTNEITETEIVARYTALLENNVAAFHSDPDAWAAQRFEQSQAVNRVCSWRARAMEWENFLAPAIAAAS
jgi:glycosyltransferase involved in cell wall biosynthesis